MKQTYLRNDGNAGLLIFFAGWGGEPSLFGVPAVNGWDCLVCYDYRSLDFDAHVLDNYAHVRLLAWSMGVWAAAQTFSSSGRAFDMAIAVNGTETPVDDASGIPVEIFANTLKYLSPVTLAKFRRRMCGSADAVRAFLAHCPQRPVDELRDELAAISDMVSRRPVKRMSWDKCIIGSRDKIFPPANMVRAWQGKHLMQIDAEHYDEALFTALLDGKEEFWTRI